MSNLWFLWFLQECHRNCWELKLVIAHSGQPWVESLTRSLFGFWRPRYAFDARCTLALWVDIEARSELVTCTGQPWIRWSIAWHDASQLVQFGIGGGCLTRSRPTILFAILQPVKRSILAIGRSFVQQRASSLDLTHHLTDRSLLLVGRVDASKSNIDHSFISHKDS